MGQPHPRIFVAELFQETNTFNPVPTRFADFVIVSDEELLSQSAAADDCMSGVVRALRHAGAHVVAGVGARARSGGLVDDAAFEDLWHLLVRSAVAAQAAAVVISLHGGMATPTITDCEGLTLKALRDALGPRVPLCVCLDVEAHVTEAMVRHASTITGATSSRDRDVVAAGERAATAALRLLRGEIIPVLAMAKTPLLLPDTGLQNDRSIDLLTTACARMRAESRLLLDISVFRGCAFADFPDMGGAVLAIADGDPAVAASAATVLAHEIWHTWRDQRPLAWRTVDDALLQIAQRARRPTVLGDAGDSVAAGAPGDSVALLAACLRRRPDLRGLFPVYDPAATQVCHEHGPGEVDLLVGGHVTSSSPRLPVTGKVRHLGAGDFTSSHVFSGRRNRVGRYAIVDVGNHVLILSDTSTPSQDPEFFALCNEPLTRFQLIVAKSMFYYREGMGGVGPCLTVRTPGLTSQRVVDHTRDCAWPAYLSTGRPSGLEPVRTWTSARDVPAF